MIDEKFIYLATVIFAVGTVSYLIPTLRGKTQPNRVGWFMWALAPMVATAAMVSQGVGLPALLTFMNGFGPLVIFIASFINPKAYWKIERFDIVCGALSLTGLLLWAVTRTGNIAILFSIMADGLAALPTIVKTYKDPASESYPAFVLSAIAGAITLLTIDTWTFEYYAFPLYFMICCLVIVGIGQYRLRVLKQRRA